MSLSVVIIALNEEQRIGDCLDSVRELTDDVVVVDAHSRDRTVEICVTRGARVFRRAWVGYSDQKNFGNAQARYDWILSLDADERVSPELARRLRAEFSGTPSRDVFSIRFENYFGARKVRFGAWNPEWHPRVFDRRKICWNGGEVHEGLCACEDAQHGRLRGAIRHLTVKSHAELAKKSEHYAALFSAQLRRAGRRPNPLKIWLNPAWRFVRDYVIRFGCLDGVAGALIAWEGARYTHLKYAGAYEPRERMRLLTQWTTAGAAMLMLSLVTLNLPLNSRTAAGVGHVSQAAASVSPDDASRFAPLVWTGDDDDNSDMDPYSADDDDDILV